MTRPDLPPWAHALAVRAFGTTAWMSRRHGKTASVVNWLLLGKAPSAVLIPARVVTL